MELKRLFFGAAIAALMAGCSSAVDDPNVTPGTSNGKLTITAGIDGAASTRLSFTEQGEQPSIKVAWQNTDQLLVDYAANPEEMAAFAIGKISADGHDAEFTGSFTTPPAKKTAVGVAVKSPAMEVNGAIIKVDLSEQAGTINELSKYDLVAGSCEYDPAASGAMQVRLHHEMTFIKGTVVLPFTPTTSTYALTLKADYMANKYYYRCADGSPSNSQQGSIKLTSAKVDGNKLTFYAALTPGTKTNLRADVVSPTGQAYNDLLIANEVKLEAGKLYTVTRNNETLSDVSLWTSDAAWTKTYDAPGYKITTIERIPAEGSDWLSVTSDGTKVTVSATANTTGAPRQAKLVFGNGSQKTTIDLTQIDESDFAGTWDMTAFKVFTTMGSTTATNYDPKWGAVGSQPSDGRTDLRVVDGVDYKNRQQLTLTNAKGKTVTAYECLGATRLTATNNISMTGLFENMKTEALSRVDHAAKSATVGIFIDTHTSTKAQRLYTGQYAGQYVALMPELSTKINSGWSFQYATIGGAQYTWYIGKVSVVGHTTTVRWEANTGGMQMLKTSGSKPSLYICGLQVMRYYNNTINSTSLIRQKAGGYSSSNFGAYAITYQGDIQMRRTADGYKEIVIGGQN